MQEILDRLSADDAGAQIATKLLLPYLNHAAMMFESGYATRDDIDAAMRFGCGYPIGPLALIDVLGASKVASGLDEMYLESKDDLHKPAQVLAEHASAGTTFYGSESESATGAIPEMKKSISKVGVVGTGTMAGGIVEVFAKAGFDVTFVGRSTDKTDAVVKQITKSLDKAIERGKSDEATKAEVLARVHGATERAALADCDLIVEAIAEDLAIKLELFADLDRIAKPGAILATTTSSLSISECAGATKRPQDVVGLHFFNPAPVMKLIEVVKGEHTSDEVFETAQAISTAIGKHPVSCGDRAGFIVNALLFPYLNDAIKLHEAGTPKEEIDEVMKESQLPLGPFQLLDVVGNDVSLAIQKTLVAEFGHEGWQPAQALEQLVAEGAMGRKTGRGFYQY